MAQAKAHRSRDRHTATTVRHNSKVHPVFQLSSLCLISSFSLEGNKVLHMQIIVTLDHKLYSLWCSCPSFMGPPFLFRDCTYTLSIQQLVPFCESVCFMALTVLKLKVKE